MEGVVGEVVPLLGDAVQAFLSDDTTALLHGVTLNRPAAAGVAGRVRDWCWQLPGSDADLVYAHYGVEPGAVVEVRERLFAGVTQVRYGEARLDLIQSCVLAVSLQAARRGLRAVVMPLVGSGLGRLSVRNVWLALSQVPVATPVEVYVLDPSLLTTLRQMFPAREG